MPRRRAPASGPCVLVASSGGHLQQLFELRDGWPRESRLWVTFDTPDAVQLLAGERVIAAFHPTNRNVANLVRNAWLAWRTLRASRASAVVTTGAGVAVPFAYVAWVLGVPIIYVEGLGRVRNLSLSARIVSPVATRLFVQWPELAAGHRKAEYRGALW